MANLRIGDRVRIKAPSNLAGATGTIWDIRTPAPFWLRLLGEHWPKWSDHAIRRGIHPLETAYMVDVDGYGRHAPPFGVIGFPYYWLEPLVPPANDEWAADKVKQISRLRPYDEPKVREQEFNQGG